MEKVGAESPRVTGRRVLVLIETCLLSFSVSAPPAGGTAEMDTPNRRKESKNTDYEEKKQKPAPPNDQTTNVKSVFHPLTELQITKVAEMSNKT